MTWSFVILLILAALAKVVLTCLPTGVVEWMISKFELHPTLNDENTTVTIDGKRLEGEEKNEIINDFNEALFLEKYDIHPENRGTPLVIDTKRGKNNISFFVYIYNNRVDVVKRYKKKVVAYRLRSDSLQKGSMVIRGELA
ncbi:YfmQ family protein [Priestia abyssalis]|uniref:YfmQ family protein n=1 Tax=Priestia abyssalis TaxID=1221450 RepID=UPI00099507A0|nr:YfmQ family protein [Priestia abyssalis]